MSMLYNAFSEYKYVICVSYVWMPVISFTKYKHDICVAYIRMVYKPLININMIYM